MHTEEAEPPARLNAPWIETRAGVRDLQRQFFRGPAELDSGPLGAAVLYDVPERLLNDPIQAERDVAGKRAWDPVMHEFDVDAVLVGNLLTEAPGCHHEAKVLQNGRMKLMGQAMDVG